MDKVKTCSKCKTEKSINDFYTKRGFSLTSHCKDCIKKSRKEYVNKNREEINKKSRDYYQIFRKHNLKSEYRERCFKDGVDGFLATVCKACLKRKGGDIDWRFLKDIWVKQDGICAVSGLKMTYISGHGKVFTNISVDRIDSSLPYLRSNVRLLCSGVNTMRLQMNDDEFVEMCKLIIKNMEAKNAVNK